MSGHRQAALKLFPLSAPDRELILAELPAADQERLRADLAELSELGFEDLPLVDAPARRLPHASQLPATPHDRLRAAPVQAVADLLASEPAGLVASLLAGHDWPWRAALLERMSPARRALVQDALDARRHAPAAPACHDFLVASLAGRIDDVERKAATLAPSAPSAVLRLIAKVIPWKR